MEFIAELFSTTVKIFALMTPPAALSAFISASKTYDRERIRHTARKTSLSIFVIGIVLFFLGDKIFSVFGFTLDAFRIGTGALLFLSAVSLMNDTPERPVFRPDDDISVVPLAIPLCMGPASIGTVMVWGATADSSYKMLVGALSILLASLSMFILLSAAVKLEKILGKTGIAVLAKLTGLLLAAIAAQVIFAGVRSILQL